MPWDLVEEARCPSDLPDNSSCYVTSLLCSFRRPAGIYCIFSKQGNIPEVHSGESTSGNSPWEMTVKDFIIKKPKTNNRTAKPQILEEMLFPFKRFFDIGTAREVGKQEFY